jgi:hypothetical protein
MMIRMVIPSQMVIKTVRVRKVKSNLQRMTMKRRTLMLEAVNLETVMTVISIKKIAKMK